ncbi:MAG: VOC family protein [Alphaproteobacteria bacterium]
MSDLNLTLDHVGVVVPDLESARGFYDRLGFQLTRESSHKAALEPGGPVVEWGSGNRCAMFHQGYFEIIGITDPARHHTHIDERLARYHGLHLLALGTEDAASLGQSLGGRVEGVGAMMELHRDVPVGNGTKPGMFRIVYLADALFPEAELFFIEQATRDVLWQPDLLDHPNGVRALEAVTICSDDPGETAARLGNLVGTAPMPTTGGGIRCTLKSGMVDLVTVTGLAARFPGVTPAASPWFAAVRFGVGDLDATRQCLANNDVAFGEGGDGSSIWVAPEYALGAIIEFAS